jgi:hypothetical protein
MIYILSQFIGNNKISSDNHNSGPMKLRTNTRFAMAGVLSIVIAVVLSAFVWGAAALVGHDQVNSSETQRTGPAATTYSDNGLTCALPTQTASYVAFLVPQIAQNSRFLNATNGSPYVYEYSDNITDRAVTTGGTLQGGATQNGSVTGGIVTHLPPVVEIVFYTFGATTSCGETNAAAAIHSIVVQVPIQDGEFDMSAATFHLSGTRE